MESTPLECSDLVRVSGLAGTLLLGRKELCSSKSSEVAARVHQGEPS